MVIIDRTKTQALQLKGRIKPPSMTFCFVPYHQEVLRAHQSHFCLRVIAEDPGFQSDVSDIQTETAWTGGVGGVCKLEGTGTWPSSSSLR